MICQIVAVDKNNCIGRSNKMAWHIPTDFKYFKETTKGHPVIMGRKTFESIGHPLPGRVSIVLTRNLNLELLKGVRTVNSVDKAIDCAKKATDYDTSKIFIIGGAQIYKATLENTDQFFITRVDTQIQGGDAFYPALPQGLKLFSSLEVFDKYKLKFQVYTR